MLIGAGQVLGGLLLFTARSAAAGIVIVMPIMLNIVVLIFALPFSTADRVTVLLMLLGCAVLLFYEWPRFAPIFGEVPHPRSATAAVHDAWARRSVRMLTYLMGAAWLSMIA